MIFLDFPCAWGGGCPQRAEWVLLFSCPEHDTIGERWLCDFHHKMWINPESSLHQCYCGAKREHLSQRISEMIDA